MIHRLFNLFILSVLSLSLSAQSVWEQANQAYAETDYATAQMLYQQLLDESDNTSRHYRAELYYNLGNAQFKQGELSQSILSYERALRLQPTHSDARHNLQFAETRITDNIADTQAFFLSTALSYVRGLLAESTWMWIGIATWLLVLVGVSLFLLGHVPALRQTGFGIAIAALICCTAAWANAGSLHHRDAERADAIIVQGIVNAKSSPDRSGTDLFTVHEGTHVTIRESVGQWCNIRVGNYQGWIPADDLERI